MVSRPNLRHHQRIATKLDVELELDNGEWVSTTLSNLSRAGFMVECSPALMTRILPNHSPIAPRQAVRMKAKFDLPILPVQSVRITADCDVIYARRLSRQVFQIGMQFVDLEGNGQDYVNQFVDKHLPND